VKAVSPPAPVKVVPPAAPVTASPRPAKFAPGAALPLPVKCAPIPVKAAPRGMAPPLPAAQAVPVPVKAAPTDPTGIATRTQVDYSDMQRRIEELEAKIQGLKDNLVTTEAEVATLRDMFIASRGPGV